MAQQFAAFCCGSYFACMWLLGIAISSWMTHMTQTNQWRDAYTKISERDYNEAQSLFRSWTQRPFVDVFVTDAFSKCPTEFPEDLIYDIWGGSRGHCDCLQREESRTVSMDTGCDRGKGGDHKAEECHDRHGLAPIVMNRFAGVRYCGKLSQKPFSDMKRPIRDPADSNKFKCPNGYEACNQKFLESLGGETYVICRSLSNPIEEDCPITSFKFKVTDAEKSLYEWRASTSNGNQGIWISRQVMQHGIERMTISPQQPCMNPILYNSAPNQQFWFAEFRRIARDWPCKESNRYQLSQDDLGVTEWDLHLWNGVLTRLDDTMHTSFSFWPSSQIKKDVSMNFYQLPLPNFKLECWNQSEETLNQMSKDAQGKGNSVTDLLDSIDDLGLGSLIAIIVVPIAGIQIFFVVGPLVCIAVAGIFASVIVNLQGSIEQLQAESDNYEQPSFYSKCMDVQIDTRNFDYLRMSIERLQGDFNAMSITMIVYCTIVAIPLALFMCTGIIYFLGSIFQCKDNLVRNLKVIPKETKAFLYTCFFGFN